MITSPVRGVAGIAGGGAHDGHRGAVAPAQLPAPDPPGAPPSVQHAGERRLEQRQHDLRLGVAEAGVELDDPRAARGDREADVEQAGERRAAPAHLVDRRLRDGRDDVVGEAGAAASRSGA